LTSAKYENVSSVGTMLRSVTSFATLLGMFSGKATMNHEPEHPGKALGRELKRFDLPKKSTAETLQIARTTLYRIIDGELDINVEMALKLEVALGHPADYWLNKQLEHDLWKARNNGTVTGIRRLVPDQAQSEFFMI